MLLTVIKMTFKAMSGRLIAPLMASILLFAALTAAAPILPAVTSYVGSVVGVVNEDESAYINMLISGVNDMGLLDSMLTVKSFTPEEARAEILADRIAAYVIIPEGYVEQISYGGTPTLTFVCNLKKPLETRAVMLAAKSGAELIRVSQAGVFATIDFAEEHDLGEEDFTSQIIFPINMKFINVLLSFDSMFRNIAVVPESRLAVGLFMARSVSCFLMMISLIIILKVYGAWFKKPLMDSFRANKLNIPAILACRQISLILLLMAAFLPMALIIGPIYLVLVFALSGLLLFVAAAFADSAPSAGILFIVIYSLVDFCAGGGLPDMSLIPGSLLFIRNFTIHYHVIYAARAQGTLIIAAIGLVFTMAGAARLILKRPGKGARQA